MQHMSCARGVEVRGIVSVRCHIVGGAACALACTWSASYPSLPDLRGRGGGSALAEQVREHFPRPEGPAGEDPRG